MYVFVTVMFEQKKGWNTDLHFMYLLNFAI